MNLRGGIISSRAKVLIHGGTARLGGRIAQAWVSASSSQSRNLFPSMKCWSAVHARIFISFTEARNCDQ